MLYVLAVLLPPLAVLLAGRPLAAVVNLLLTILLWLPGVIHACFVVADAKARQRNQQVIDTIKSVSRTS